MVLLTAGFYSVCEAYHVYDKDESFYYLRKVLGVGRGSPMFTSNDFLTVWKHFRTFTFQRQPLCIARATAPVINLTIVLIILPVCQTFNKIVHKVLSKVSSRLLAHYLENLKDIHHFFAMTLVFTCGKLGVRLRHDNDFMICCFSYSFSRACYKWSELCAEFQSELRGNQLGEGWRWRKFSDLTRQFQ